NSGEWAGSPPTNNPIKFEGVSYIHVKAGKITWQGDYYDSKKLDEELKPGK
ncbi:TPA: polyketide cyclase, partial [Citrobacter braakii]|nr:polyketide cyclase [Citrobacter braakii]